MVLHFSFDKSTPIFNLQNVKKTYYNSKDMKRFLQQNATQYAAKRLAICSKTQCYLQQNAMQSGAKRETKCSKTQQKVEKVMF